MSYFSAAVDGAWAVGGGGAIYRYRHATGAWEGIPGGLVQVDGYSATRAIGTYMHNHIG